MSWQTAWTRSGLANTEVSRPNLRDRASRSGSSRSKSSANWSNSACRAWSSISKTTGCGSSMTGTVASSSRDRDTEYRCSTLPGSVSSPNRAKVSVARFRTGVPVMPKNLAFGSAPRICPARDSDLVGLGAVRLVDHHDDVVPGRQVLAGVGELVDGRGDDAAHVVGQQGAQLLAGGRAGGSRRPPSRR